MALGCLADAAPLGAAAPGGAAVAVAGWACVSVVGVVVAGGEVVSAAAAVSADPSAGRLGGRTRGLRLMNPVMDSWPPDATFRRRTFSHRARLSRMLHRGFVLTVAQSGISLFWRFFVRPKVR